jgi:hypothetical protein
VPLAGNITFSGASALYCPTGSNFNDSMGGLYGPNGSYLALSTFCENAEVGVVLVSSLEFTCNVCPRGQYLLRAGSSDGTPSQSSHFPWQLCPAGAVCEDSGVMAVPGYWGAPDVATSAGASSPIRSPAPRGTASFVVCPEGYCCSGIPPWPCSSMGSCSGHRTGALCGDCAPQYVESLGSGQCTPRSSCASDRFVVVRDCGWRSRGGSVAADGCVRCVAHFTWSAHWSHEACHLLESGTLAMTGTRLPPTP